MWNALQKWQSRGQRHKQTHKSPKDWHTDDSRDRQAPSATAISFHLLPWLFFSLSGAPFHPSCLYLLLPTSLTHLSIRSVSLFSPCPGCLIDPTPSISSSNSLLPSCSSGGGPQRGRESICPSPSVSASLSLCLGYNIKVSESMVWVLRLRVKYEYYSQGTERNGFTAGRGMKEKERGRERWKEGGQFKVQNVKCWYVCFPSLLFWPMTKEIKTNTRFDILYTYTQPVLEQSFYSENV